MTKKTLDPASLGKFPEDSIVTRLDNEFIDKHVALYRQREEKKEAEKKSVEESKK